MLIDFHVHTFPDALAKGAVESLHKASGYPYHTNGTVADTLKKMDEWGVDRAVFLNIAVSPRSQKKVNDFAISVNDCERIFAFGSVHPDAPDATDELVRLKVAGIRGIKLHPAYQGFRADDEKLFPIYRRCAELSLPILFHAGWDVAFPDAVCSDPHQCRRIIDLFPENSFVFAHVGGMDRWDEVERLLVGTSAYFDLSFASEMMDPAQFRRILLNHDPDRLLFATDCPWCTPPQISAFLDEAGITGALREKIDHQNAERLLGLR